MVFEGRRLILNTACRGHGRNRSRVFASGFGLWDWVGWVGWVHLGRFTLNLRIRDVMIPTSGRLCLKARAVYAIQGTDRNEGVMVKILSDLDTMNLMRITKIFLIAGASYFYAVIRYFLGVRGRSAQVNEIDRLLEGTASERHSV